MTRDRLSLSEARRIALAAQGFDRPRPNGRIDVRHIRRTIQRLGLLQLDYVNVLSPSHYLVLFSRLGPYEPSRLDDLVYRRREFTEAWAHEASIVPAATWPLLRACLGEDDRRLRALARFMKEHAAYADRVLEELRRRGPLGAEELPEPEGGRGRDSWGWTAPKAALEGHLARGTVAVARRRPNFARTYDLAERVIPRSHYRRRLERADGQRELLNQAARAHGVGTASDLADYYRLPVRESRRRIAELLDAGVVREVRVEGWREPAYIHREARTPRRIDVSALLSPFDSVIWYRPRAARLFQFEYRLEIFVLQEKRRWGYYVLPFLLGERLVARVDLKADRAARRLLVPAAHLEPGAPSDAVAAALAAELRVMAGWLGLDTISVGRRGGFARALAAAVRD